MNAATEKINCLVGFDMNFFKLYIGDYQRDTGTLSLAEHGAYMLMLQHFYATEKALPIGRELHRLLRADSKIEREAIDSITAKFWRLDATGLINDRALEEIKKREHQATVNREVGKKGGRPKKSESKPNENRIGSFSEPTGNPNHSQSKPPYPIHEEGVGDHYPVGGGFDVDPTTGEIRGGDHDA